MFTGRKRKCNLTPWKTWYSIHRFYQRFIYSPTDALVSYLKENNIKLYIKTGPKYFGTVTKSSGSALVLAY